MHDIDKLSSKLVRILNVETCEHPGLSQAVSECRPSIEAIEWHSADKPSRQASDWLAGEIEDKVGYYGHHIPVEMLPRWRDICYFALSKAGSECSKTSCQTL